MHPDIFLLDDGFQHFRLKRDEDLVFLIDALDPLAGGIFKWEDGASRWKPGSGDGGDRDAWIRGREPRASRGSSGYNSRAPVLGRMWFRYTG